MRRFVCSVLTLLCACSPVATEPDAGRPAEVDSGSPLDAGVVEDAGASLDAGLDADAGAVDASVPDASVVD
ncbi:MAG: hypothetical protein ABTQ32_22990, partial [Myxococcaceae bacterium]